MGDCSGETTVTPPNDSMDDLNVNSVQPRTFERQSISGNDFAKAEHLSPDTPEDMLRDMVSNKLRHFSIILLNMF